jgi:para-aminobenzoate synthetase/4-amino-4-deoxychorismate lyase
MSATPHADPGRGVFETMLVLGGRPVELDAHIERLGASVAELYGAELPASARDAVLAEAGGTAHGKLRIAAIPSTGELVAHGQASSPADPRIELRLSSEEIEPAAVFPGAERGIALRSVTVAGGLGEHKWADRGLLERIEAAFPPRQLALLLDSDGSVLEASRASVFRVEGGRLTTPPSDGRILPSIARRQAIEVALGAGIEVREGVLSAADLRGGEAFLTGSVRGVEPVHSVDGVQLQPPGEVSAQVAAGLERRWLQAPGAEPVAAGAGGRPGGPPER